jgi:hypothetical protein
MKQGSNFAFSPFPATSGAASVRSWHQSNWSVSAAPDTLLNVRKSYVAP